MDIPDTHYAVTPDGVYIAYQVIGDGPVDVVWQSDWPGNIDVERQDVLAAIWMREVSAFSRLILHDRRVSGLSSRNVALPNLETRASISSWSSTRRVGTTGPDGHLRVGRSDALLAATRPERVRSMVWSRPDPRFAEAPDYPWGRGREDMEAELRDIELWGTKAYGELSSPTRRLEERVVRCHGNGSHRRMDGDGESKRVYARRGEVSRADLVRNGRSGRAPIRQVPT